MDLQWKRRLVRVAKLHDPCLYLPSAARTEQHRRFPYCKDGQRALYPYVACTSAERNPALRTGQGWVSDRRLSSWLKERHRAC